MGPWEYLMYIYSPMAWEAAKACWSDGRRKGRRRLGGAFKWKRKSRRAW